jgi:glutamyl-tRNA reductase
VFLGDGPTEPTAGRRLAGSDAYALLVEIVSGLRSPLVGETEVQAQFKGFLADLDPERHGTIRRLGQQVLADAKTIRHRHLQGLGAHSYGHLSAKHIRAGTRVVLVGTGALAAEILAAIGMGAAVDQWGRRESPDGPPASNVSFSLFSAARQRPVVDDAVSLVIAAPASADDLAAIVGRYSRIVTAIDLRAADERAPLAVGVPVVTLDDLFAAAEPADATAATRIAAARLDIRSLARAFDRREEFRPFGWDDLCA